MRNPLALLPTPRTPDIRAEASVPVASKWKHPVTSNNLFTRSEAGVQLDTMRTSGTVHSIVRRITSDVARQHWQLADTTNPDAEPAADHAFLRVWDAPNERMTPTGRAFRQLGGLYLEALGEAAAVEVFSSLYATIDPRGALEHAQVFAALERLCGARRRMRGGIRVFSPPGP